MVLINITCSHIDMPILGDALAKSQNATGNQLQNAKIFKINNPNNPQFLIILEKRNVNVKVTKLKIQAYW